MIVDLDHRTRGGALAPEVAGHATTALVGGNVLYLFEQTLLLPVEAMQDATRAPLRVIERAFGRSLSS